MLESFVKEWGAWAISVLSLGVAALAYLNSRKAVHITEKEHVWKSADRDEGAACRKWCESQCSGLALIPECEVAPDKLKWAKWGDENGYFHLGWDGGGAPILTRRR